MERGFTLSYFADGERRELINETENADLAVVLTDDGRRRVVTARAKTEVELAEYREELPFRVSRDGLCFTNGYQSWTDSAERRLSEKERDVTRLPRKLVNAFSFDRYGDAAFYPYSRRKLHGYDVFYVKGGDGGWAVNLNSNNAWLVFEVDRGKGGVSAVSDVAGAKLAPGAEFTVCDFVYGSEWKGLPDEYFPKRDVKKIFGYTSWYNYYQNINEEILLRDLEGLDGRFNLFQIDDGYAEHVGDWLDVDKEKFPNGLEPVVKRVRGRGFTPGIWLAPFVAEEKSRLFAEHADWFKSGDDCGFVKCGCNWSGFYALDLGNPDALGYIRRCLKHYLDMGFGFFKLDFLYAACLPRYEGLTRAQAAARAFDFLRDALGDALILGCGAPLSSSAGRFDYLRVGPDVSLDFDDKWFMRHMHRERVSTKVTLQNTVYRSFADGRMFGCDPDVFLLRDRNTKLSPEQRRALLTLNALFGSVLMTSDNLAEYDEAKKALLAQGLELFREAEVTGFSRGGHMISVEYKLGGETKTILYFTDKGVLV